MFKFDQLSTSSPLKELRSFIKQEHLDVSGQVGGRSHRTAKDVYEDILEAVKERERLQLLQKPLFEEGTMNDMVIIIPRT